MENPYAAPTHDTSHVSPNQGAPGSSTDWTIGEAFSVGWDAVKRSPVPLIAGYFLILVISQGVSSIGNAVFGGGDEPTAQLMASLLTLPVSIVVSAYLTVGATRATLAAARGEEVNLGIFFSGMDRLFVATLVTLAIYAGVMVGAMLLIVPGIILALGWALATPLIADTDLGVGEILSESWRLTSGQRGRIFVFGLAACGVALLGVLALGVGLLVAIPVIGVAFAHVYLAMSGREAGTGHGGAAMQPAQL